MKKLASVLTREQPCQLMKQYIIKEFKKRHESQRKDYGVVKVAQDVHAHAVVFCVQEEGQQPKAPRKMDWLRYDSWISDLIARSEKVYSCYEAGPTGFALHRRLTKLGADNVVVAPTRLDNQGKRVNNDQSDTRQLAVRLDRYVAGNKDTFSVVHVPTEQEEQRRAWTRQRKQLQGQRLSVAAQGRSLVLTQGIAISNLWWRPTAWKGHQQKLADWLVEHLQIFHRIIVVINQEMEQLQSKIKAMSQGQRRPKGMGAETAAIIENEVGDWKRFTSWRRVGSYSGLVGGVSQSGQYQADLSITKVGNKRLRTALIEMAWRMSRLQPDYWLVKKWKWILAPEAKAHRRLRKKAIVAFARALMVDLWRWKTGRISPEKLGWIMC
jgi:transposase